MRRTPLRLACLLFGALPLFAQRSVIVVDAQNGPGADFTSLQLAVDSAGPGDLIMIRRGSYSVTITKKSANLQAEVAGQVKLDPLVVERLTAKQTVVIRGCDAGPSTSLLMNCQGVVHLEDGHYNQLKCTADSDVVLRHVKIQNGPFSCAGGLFLTDSSVYIYDSTIHGRDAQTWLYPTCVAGSGISMDNSSVYLEQTVVIGGAEANPEPAAPGIQALGTLRSLEEVNSFVSEGPFYVLPPPPAYRGVSPVPRPGGGGRVSIPSPLIEGQASSASISGRPGDIAFVAFSTGPALTSYFPAAGAFHGDLGSMTLMRAGTIPASHVLSASFTAPSYAGPDTVTPIYMQTLLVRPGRMLLGAPTHLYILDPNY